MLTFTFFVFFLCGSSSSSELLEPDASTAVFLSAAEAASSRFVCGEGDFLIVNISSDFEFSITNVSPWSLPLEEDSPRGEDPAEDEDITASPWLRLCFLWWWCLWWWWWWCLWWSSLCFLCFFGLDSPDELTFESLEVRSEFFCFFLGCSSDEPYVLTTMLLHWFLLESGRSELEDLEELREWFEADGDRFLFRPSLLFFSEWAARIKGHSLNLTWIFYLAQHHATLIV